MIQHRFKQQWFAAAFVMSALLALAACGSAQSTKNTPLPSADSVLTKAEQAPLKDASFNSDATSSNYKVDAPWTGMLTTIPKRTETFSKGSPALLTNGSDYYVHNPDGAWSQVDVAWFLNNAPEPVFLLQPDFLNYRQLQGTKVLAGETVNGVPTWHLHGTLPNPSWNTPNQPEVLNEDLWVRQDNSYPAKLVFSFLPTTGGASGYTITLVFTKWDTGLTIALPQVSN